MSLSAMKLVWSSRLEPTRKLALLALADRANDSGGNCWFSMAEIAARASISRSQAQRIVRSHVAQGLVSVTLNQSGGKPGTIPCYQLHLDRIAALADTGSTGATGSADATGSTHAHEGSHGCTGEAAPMRQTGSTNATLNIKNEQATTKATGKKSARASLPTALFPEVTAGALQDWQAVRKAKRSGPLTETAARGFRREAMKSGLTLQQAVELCCEKGWAGLNADWDEVRRRAGAASERQAVAGGMAGAIQPRARSPQTFADVDYREGLTGGLLTS